MMSGGRKSTSAISLLLVLFYNFRVIACKDPYDGVPGELREHGYSGAIPGT